MKKNLSVCSVLICLIVLFFTSSMGYAMETVKFCNDSEFSFRGFIRNDLGMFTRSLPYADNGNQLAGARTTLRGYFDLKLGEHFSARLVPQFAWDPYYRSEHGADSSRVVYNDAANHTEKVRHYGKEYSEYDDINDVIREVYVDWKPNNNFDLKLGRQIAIWGESLTDAIADVIHPPDLRNGFFVGNQEDARIPQWMARGIYQIPTLKSNLEFIISPNWVAEKYRIGRVGSKSGNNSTPFDDSDDLPGQRFAQYGEDRGSISPWIPFNAHAEYPKSSISGMRWGARTSTITESMQFGFLYWHTQTYSPVTEWGARAPDLIAMTPMGPVALARREMTIIFPMYDIVGFYANKQLENIPGVIRAEAAYSWNKPYTSLKGVTSTDFPTGNYLYTDSGVVRRDWFKYMVAYDLNGYIYPQWHKTAPFDVTFEHIGEWIPNAIHDRLQFSDYNTELPEFNAAFNVRVSTSWFYGKIETAIVAGYQTFGASGLMMPSIGFRPGWFNKNLTFDLKYYHIFGRNHYEGMGIMKGKDVTIFTTQFNF